MTTTRYDLVPYPSQPVHTMFPPFVAECAELNDSLVPQGTSVLELGANDATQLTWSASKLGPDWRWYGVDNAPSSLASARARVAGLNLADRIQLVHGDLTAEDLGESISNLTGQTGFDFILMHGVLSWLPDRARNCVFSAIQRLLLPQGLACVSYNVYPGWHFRQVLRDVFLWAQPGLVGGAQSSVAAGEVALRLAAAQSPDSLYAKTISTGLEGLGAIQGATPKQREYVFHEHLNPDNHPILFSQFFAEVRAHKLRYIGEADASATVSFARFTQQAVYPPTKLLLARQDHEQWFDFVGNRPFRVSIIGRDADGPPAHTLNLEKVARFVAKYGMKGTAT